MRNHVILKGIEFSAATNRVAGISIFIFELLSYYSCDILQAVYVLLICLFITLFSKGVGDLGISDIVSSPLIGLD